MFAALAQMLSLIHIWILEEKQILTAKALYAKRKKKPMPERPYHWSNQSIVGILELQEYTGCTCNFKTYSCLLYTSDVYKRQHTNRARTDYFGHRIVHNPAKRIPNIS